MAVENAVIYSTKHQPMLPFVAVIYASASTICKAETMFQLGQKFSLMNRTVIFIILATRPKKYQNMNDYVELAESDSDDDELQNLMMKKFTYNKLLKIISK